MKLTGKCLEDFEKWFKKFDGIELFDLSVDIQYGAYISVEDVWDNLPDSFKYGVYVDFALSKNYVLDIHPVLKYDEEKYTSVQEWVAYVIELNKAVDLNNDEAIECKTLPEAQKETIKKFDKIYNQR